MRGGAVIALGLGLLLSMCQPAPPQPDGGGREPAMDREARREPGEPPRERLSLEPQPPERSQEPARPEPRTEQTRPVPPPRPSALTAYITGDPADAQVTPKGPGLILMGGSREVDDAFRWWKPRINGGDVVILRTSGSDGYNDYLYREIGGADSVVTLLVTSRELADSAYVGWHISRAEGVFLAGGDQSKYLGFWQGTRVQGALQEAYKRGAVIGGTSAGLAVLGQFVFDAKSGSVTSGEALADPYHRSVSLTRGFLDFGPLQGVITDSHFGQRDRMGRLLAFVARLSQDGWHKAPLGLGVDERTALVLDAAGKGLVMGRGAVYLLKASGPPQRCAPGQPLHFESVSRFRLVAGDSISLPAGSVAKSPLALTAKDGALSPKDPYATAP